jgi:DNA-binding transcriptional regulator YiaG
MPDSIGELLDLRALLGNGSARQIRESAGLSAVAVARQLDVSPATVTRWEQGIRFPRGANARRYARLLRRLAGPATAVS